MAKEAQKLQKKQLARPESGVEPTHAAVKRAQVEANVRAALARRKRDGDRASGGGDAKARKDQPKHKVRLPGGLPDEATLQTNLQKYHANLARAMKLKREHGDLTKDQEQILTDKFEEMRETIRMTEEILAMVRAQKQRDAEALERAALACGTCAPGTGWTADCACCRPTSGG